MRHFSLSLSAFLSFLFLSLLCILIGGCQTDHAGTSSASHLGEINLKVSASGEAEAAFEEGLLLLHSFEYEDAREAFDHAQALDSSFAMAYWGEAMTHNHNLWSQQDYEKGTDALKRMETHADVSSLTPLESDLIASTKILYGEGDKADRDQAYADKLAQLHEIYPDNHEVAAFYALSLLGSVPIGRDVEIYEQGAAIVQGIIAENPQHPGALHYLIHSYDDPGHAFMALEAANNYSKVAPDAAHALHMPSHIYVALGMWDEVITSNIASYDASVNRMQRKGLGDHARSYHALAWLQYGLLQKGNIAEASRIMEEKNSYMTEKKGDKRARTYQIEMVGTYLAALGNWDSPWAELDIKTDDLNIVAQSLQSFIKGMHAYATLDEAGLTEIIRGLDLKQEAASKLLDDRGLSMCGAVTRQAPNQLHLDQSLILEMELQAHASLLKGDSESAESWLQQAVDLESSISYSYGPPEVVKPSWEMYGDFLMSMNRPADAKVQYAEALKRTPKRVWTLDGLREAMALLGEQTQADSLEHIIADMQGGPEVQAAAK